VVALFASVHEGDSGNKTRKSTGEEERVGVCSRSEMDEIAF